MKKILFLPRLLEGLLLFVVVAFIPTINAQSINKDWVGTYEFFDAQKGGIASQPNNFITYTLTVSQKGDSLSARFAADGTQTLDDYECSIQESENSIKVFFIKDLGGTEADKFKPLKKGDLLFTLNRIKSGRKTKYLFKADDYQIDLLSARAGTPIYFRKTK